MLTGTEREDLRELSTTLANIPRRSGKTVMYEVAMMRASYLTAKAKAGKRY